METNVEHGGEKRFSWDILRRKRGVAATVATAMFVAGAWAIKPEAPSLGECDWNGIEQHIDVTDLTNQPASRIAVVYADNGETIIGGCGLETSQEFEIGSISKGLLGLAVQSMIERGEITENTTLGELTSELTGDVAQATVGEITSHRSGLPRLAERDSDSLPALLELYSATDPYFMDCAELIDFANQQTRSERKVEYSNFAASLLGFALAANQNKTFADFLRDEVLQPYGMKDSFISSSQRTVDAWGYFAGVRAEPWTADEILPAGGVVSTPQDMATLLAALMGDKQPGSQALKPKRNFDDEVKVGHFWMTSKAEETGRAYHWHDGGTYGYSSFLGVRPESNQGVVVLIDYGIGAAAASGMEIMEGIR